MKKHITVLALFAIASTTAIADFTMPEFKSLDAEMSDFVDALLAVSAANDETAILALAHPGLSACPGWASGMQAKLVTIAGLVYGTVDPEAEREYFDIEQEKFLAETKASGQIWPIAAERQIHLRSGNRTSALRVARHEEDWRFVWQCI